MYSPSRYLPIPTQLGLNNLDLSGFNKIYLTLPILRLILPISGLSGLLKANEGSLGTSNQYFLLCMCSPSCYSSIPCYLGFKTLDFSDYNKI